MTLKTIKIIYVIFEAKHFTFIHLKLNLDLVFKVIVIQFIECKKNYLYYLKVSKKKKQKLSEKGGWSIKPNHKCNLQEKRFIFIKK